MELGLVGGTKLLRIVNLDKKINSKTKSEPKAPS